MKSSCESVRIRARIAFWREAGVGVLCAPKFGALMRDTLRPDALPASPVGAPRGCGQAFAALRGSAARCSAARNPCGLCRVCAGCVRLSLLLLVRCWLRAALRGICFFSLASLAALAALLCCSDTLASLAQPLRLAADSLAPCAALLVSCWFPCLVVSMLRSVADSMHLVKPCGSAAGPALLLLVARIIAGLVP